MELDKAIELAEKLEKDIIRVKETMDESIGGLKEAIDKLIQELNTDDELYQAENCGLESEMEH